MEVEGLRANGTDSEPLSGSGATDDRCVAEAAATSTHGHRL